MPGCPGGWLVISAGPGYTMIDKKTIIRRLSLSAYFIAAFLTFLLLLFPFDRTKATMEYEVRRRTGFDLSVARLAPRFLDRFVMYDVVVSGEQGKILFE